MRKGSELREALQPSRGRNRGGRRVVGAKGQGVRLGGSCPALGRAPWRLGAGSRRCRQLPFALMVSKYGRGIKELE